MEKMKILHSEASTGWGGQEIRILEEMHWFRSRGHELILVGPPHATLVKKAEAEGFKTAYLFFTKNRMGREVFGFSSIIRKFKPDVVATHSSVDSWVGLMASSVHRIKRRVRYRHVSTPVKGHYINSWQYKKLCNLVLTTGECIRKPLIDTFGLPHDKVVSAPTAIRPPQEMPGKKDARLKLQSELRLSSNSRFVGQVSVLRSWKGHKFLIDAFQCIADSFPNLHLVLVGTGPIEEDLKKVASTANFAERIHLVGHKDNPWQYFRAFEIATLVSVSNEGIPQSLLQAMHAGTPVIGTNVGGIPEIVRNESTGLLVKPSETSSLANAMTRLLGNCTLQSKMSRNARKLTSENFRWDSLGQKIEDLFRI